MAIGALDFGLDVTLDALLFKLLLLLLPLMLAPFPLTFAGKRGLFLLVANLTKETPSSTKVSGKVNACLLRSSLTRDDEAVDEEQLEELTCLLLLTFDPMKPLLLLLLLLFVHACSSIGAIIASSLVPS